MLTLPIKNKWFEMIIQGEKKEEYRKITPYYETRFKNLFGEINDDGEKVLTEESSRNKRLIKLKNGYEKNALFAIVQVSLREDFGVEEWGAERFEVYFVLKIHRILKIYFDDNHVIYLCDGESCKDKCFGKDEFCKYTSNYGHSILRQLIEGG